MSCSVSRAIAGLAVALTLATQTPGSAAAADSPRAGSWSPPISPAVVLSRFDGPAAPWLPGHRGIDLRAGVGVPVRAAGAGRVSFVGRVAGRGVLTIDHGGLRTSYEPIDAAVVLGQAVAAGALVGTVATGSGHCGDGSCLHLGLRRGRQYLDPLLLITSGTVRLLPW